ncbi:MAG TPA: DUF6350 family protein [Microbacteriaceae bacterium]|nr:DUF6350 family protein [Microbacteriaceae bacterium]
MKRVAVLSVAALDALVAAAVGLAVCLIPAVVIWIAQYGMAGGARTPWQAAGDVWLVGHGVDLTVAVSTRRMAALGLPDHAGGFTVTLAAAGLGLLTALVAARVGRRSDRAGHPWAGVIGVAAVLLAVGALVTTTTPGPAVFAETWQGVLLPAAVGVVGAGVGVAYGRATTKAADRRRWRLPAGLAGRALAAVRLGDVRVRSGLAAAVRGAAVAALVFAALAALALFVSLFGHYAQVVGLYEGVGSGVGGGIILTLAQVILVPNAVAWSMAWLAGPGFAVGAGTVASPLGVQLGGMPALPLLGAVPRNGGSFGLVTVLVPVAAGVVAGLLVRRRTGRAPYAVPTWLGAVALGIGVLCGVAVGLVLWWCSGGVGPGGLARFGPAPLPVGAAVAAEVALGAALGLFSARLPDFGRVRRLERHR